MGRPRPAVLNRGEKRFCRLTLKVFRKLYLGLLQPPSKPYSALPVTVMETRIGRLQVTRPAS